jgi:hypothetical protein
VTEGYLHHLAKCLNGANPGERMEVGIFGIISMVPAYRILEGIDRGKFTPGLKGEARLRPPRCTPKDGG